MTRPVRAVVVTGATGFIGTNLCPRLRAQGLEVRGVTRDPAALPDGVAPFPTAGLHDRKALRRAFDGVDAVVHLAARAHVLREDAAEAERIYHEVNVGGAEVVLEEAERAGVGRFIMASSIKAVGEDSGGEVWDEYVEAAPVDPYGRSKLEAERMMLDRSERSGMHAVALRLPIVYGPGVKANMLSLFRIIERGVPLPIGLIHNRRSMLYVGNLAAAVERLLDTPEMGRGVFFLSDGEDLSTPELARRIGRAVGRPARLLPVPPAALVAMGRMADALRRVPLIPGGSAAVQRLTGSLRMDPGAFRRRYDFEPPYSTQDGLDATGEWFLATRSRRHRAG